MGCTATAQTAVTVIDVRCGNNNDKVEVCHNGNSLCIAQSAVQAHLNQGDCLGGCPCHNRHSQEVDDGSTNVAMSSITVFPNPNSGQFTIAGLQPGSLIQIYNVLGQLISTYANGQGDNKEFNISSQPNGLYLLRIANEKGAYIAQKKILKTR